MNSAVELFGGASTGSGQVYLSELNEEKLGARPGDFQLLSHVARLDAFDVYTLRIRLRNLNIEVDGHVSLDLSPKKKEELNGYMQTFTQALVKHVYGHDTIESESSGDIIGLFSHPNVEIAAQRLKSLATKLKITVPEIPRFLEDFADVYLSLAYFQQQLDRVVPEVFNFVAELSILRENWEVRQDQRTMRTCDQLASALGNLIARVTGRFEAFHQSTDSLWEDISAERFQKVADLIRGNHVVVAGVLCGLVSKMNAWKGHFPDERVGGPKKRSDVINSEIAPGIDRILKLDATKAVATIS